MSEGIFAGLTDIDTSLMAILTTIPDRRERIATAVLSGMLAADGNDPRWTGKDAGPDYQRGGGKWLNPGGVARQAVDIADALIAELAKTKGETP